MTNSKNVFDIYMEQPRGFEKGGEDHVWKLKKTLYGTMQGAHDWAKNLDKTFQDHGYYKSCADPQIRSRVLNNELILTSTWTDDILGTSSTAEGEKLAKYELGSSYKIKNIGEAKLILGMHITQNKNRDVTLTQKAYSKCMLERFKMNHCAPTSTPLPPGSLLKGC